MIDFADAMGQPFDPWQRWLAIHIGELLPDGRPRFRIILILIARQNGKTHFAKILALWWLFVELPGSRPGRPTVLGTSSKLDYAKEAWSLACDDAQDVPFLRLELPNDRNHGVRESNGEQTLSTVHRTRYKIAAANTDAGRSLTVDRLMLDELRQHHDWTAWNAAEGTTNAVADAQIVCLSNQGDSRAVVLRAHRKAALAFLEDGTGDERLGLFEWSSPDGSDPTDPVALAAANPNYGGRVDAAALLGSGLRAKLAGGEQLTGFKTEYMCMDVPVLDPAVDPEDWRACLEVGDLSEVRGRVACCVDVSLDGQHAAVIAAAVLPPAGDLEDDELGERVRLEVVRAWHGPGCTAELRRELPGLIRKVRPRVLGWFPSGPAAAVAAQLADRKRSRVAWPPAGVKVVEITKEQTSVCMGFAEQVKSHAIAQSDDPMLNAHVLGAEKQYRADAWVFGRKDSAGPINGAYGAAGAVHLARTLPAGARLRVVAPRRPADES